MFRLKKVRIQNFKCFEDTGFIKIEPGCTTLIGANESGKSSFLEALSYLENDEEIHKKCWRHHRYQPQIDAWFEADGKTWPELLRSKSPRLMGIVKPLRHVRITRYTKLRSIEFVDKENGEEVLSEQSLEVIENDIRRYLWGSSLPMDEYEKALKELQQKAVLVDYWRIVEEYIPKQITPQNRGDSINLLEDLKSKIENKLSKRVFNQEAKSKLIAPIDELLTLITKNPLGVIEAEAWGKSFKALLDQLEERGDLLDKSTLTERNLKDPEDLEDIISIVKAWKYKRGKGSLLKTLNQLLRSSTLEIPNPKEIVKEAITTIYFDEYRDRLPEDLTVKKAYNNPMVTLLFKIARRPPGILKQSHGPDRIQTMEIASLDFTDQVSQYWSQQPKNVKLSIDGDIFGIRVASILEDGKETPPLPPSDLSRGIQWYLGFFTKFWGESDKEHKNAILLLDDVAVYLHPKGQKDLLNLFEKMSVSNQIIYSTHFPYLIPSDLSKIRVCVHAGKKKADIYNKFTQVPLDEHTKRADALAPIRASLGISLGDSMFSGDKTLIVEGITDRYYLEALSRYLKKYKKPNIESKELTILPAGDADRAVKWGLFHEKEDLPYFVLLDSGKEGTRQKNHAESTYGDRGFNNEVQHLGKREGFRYPEDVCTKDTDILD